MNKRGPAEADGSQEDAPPAAGARESGIVSILRAQRPSWESVGEFLRDGSHREQIASCALRDPAFAEVIRWMVNEATESDEGDTPSAA